MNNLQIFEKYRQLGYKVIPLHFGLKSPVLNSWNNNYDHNLIETYFKNSNSKCNFGILLGDLVDVEGDSVAANEKLIDLFRGINHPIYSSAKSLHHIFINPYNNLTRVSFDGIELRAHRHQSVIPPSIHKNGAAYKWLTKVYDVSTIPVLPDFFNDFLNRAKKSSYRKKYANKTKPGHTQVACIACKNKVYLHKKRFDLELQVFKNINQKWTCKECRKFDIREAVRIERLTNKRLHCYHM